MNFKSTLPAAVIFDMDGVLVDSNPFHVWKWAELLSAHGIAYNPDELPKQVLGPRNDTILRFFLGAQLREEEILRLSEELEEKFRKAFRPHAKLLPGLEALMYELQRAGIPMAVASAAMAKNVEFVVDTLRLRSLFRCLVTGDEVSRAKPDPEIYLKTAKNLGVEPAACVAFEDSFVGVEAVKRAGMKCVAIASTFPLADLRTRADLAVESFEEMTLDWLRQLFDTGARLAYLL